MAKRVHNLDFSLLPDLSSTSAWYSLDEVTWVSLTRLPETIDRVHGALHFCYMVNSGENVRAGQGPETIKNRESYLRASLAEFVSIEETLERELLNAGLRGKSIKLYDSLNPMVHIVRELRHLEIHLQTRELSAVDKEVIFGGKRHRIQVWITGNISVTSFNRSKTHSITVMPILEQCSTGSIPRRNIGEFRI